MEIHSINEYVVPKYPEWAVIANNPDMLRRHAPVAWLRKEVVAAALVAFIAAGCDRSIVAPPKIKKSAAPEKKNADGSHNKQTAKSKVSVAPLFLAGEGRGSIGCRVISPPVFLSEEDAKHIIVEMLAKEGVLFDEKDVPLDDIAFLNKEEQYFKDRSGRFVNAEVATGRKSQFVLDAYNFDLNLGFEFISERDHGVLGGTTSNGTVQSYDLISVARNLQDKLVERGKINAVVFYDPMPRQEINYMVDRENFSPEEWIKELDRRLEADKNKARDLLKNQVAGFIVWAKETGLFKQQEPKRIE